MPEDFEEEGGNMSADSGGGGGLPNTDPNANCQYINGQWVCNNNEQPNPQTPPANTPNPNNNECINCSPNFGTRGNYFWDSKEIIKKALQPLDKKKKQ